MKNLLIPTDFSEYAFAAVEYAVTIAKVRKSNIHLVSVITSTEVDEYAKVETQMETLKNNPIFKGLQVVSYIKMNSHICNAIIDCANDVKAELILMGSHGSSTIAEIILGSNTEKVVRRSLFNVLTVKHRMVRNEIKNIAFASDFSQESNKIFCVVKDIAEKFSATIHLLKINTPTHFEPTRVSMGKINTFINNEKLILLDTDKYKVVLYNDTTEELGILNYCIENEIDFIALGIHHNASIWKMLHESTSQNLVIHSFRPVMTIPIPE